MIKQMVAVGLGLTLVLVPACERVFPVMTVGVGGFAIDRAAVLDRLAHPPAADWTVGRLTSPAVERLRKQAPANVVPMRHLEALTATCVGAPAARTTAAPTFHYITGDTFYLTEAGTLYKLSKAGTTTSYSGWAASGDTFPNTAISMSSDGKRVYLQGLKGNFYVLDASTGLNVSGSPVAMGGAQSTIITNTAPAPFVDGGASRPDGQMEYVYAVNNSGLLYKFQVSALAGTTPKVTQSATFQMPRDATSGYTEVFRAAPVVFNGQAIVASWDYNATAALQRGYVTYWDTNANAQISRTAIDNPVWAAPSVEFDNNLKPVLAFVPSGYVVQMVDLVTGATASTVPLLVNQTTPTSGVLAGYNYGTTGISTVSKTLTNGLTVSDTPGSVTPPERDTSQIYGTLAYDLTATPQNTIGQFGYVQFYVATSDTFVGTSQRGIIDAQVRLNCVVSSNANGQNNTLHPLRGFLCSNFLSPGLSSGTAWTTANVTSSLRPAWPDGVQPQHTTSLMNQHSTYELTPNAGNSFASTGSNTYYNWSAKGRITALDQAYSFVFVHDDAQYVNTSGNNGVPHANGAPRFGATDPTLVLTLSGESIVNPTMSNAIAIDSTNRRIYCVNTNALYAASYLSPTYDTVFTPTSFAERAASLANASSTYFSLTNTGATSGPVDSSTTPHQYVDNPTSVFLSGSNVFVQDNFPSTSRCAITEFDLGSPMATVNSVNLTALQADAKVGGTYMSYDYVNGKLYATTYDPSNTAKGRLWSIN